MSDNVSPFSRRNLLKALGAGYVAGLAGCNQVETSKSPTRLEPRTSPITDPPTQVDNTAPTILVYDSQPLDNGKRLAVHMKGEDDRELGEARIQYGERVLKEQPDGRRVDMEGVLEGIPDADPAFSGQVVYTLRDAAGNETETEAYPDRQAPEIAVITETPATAEEIETVLKGTDNVGLHEIELLLNGEPVLDQDLTGQRSVSQEEILSENVKGMKPGEMNSLEAQLEDALGNKARKKVEQYVRKYDKMEDTRLDFGVQYQPFFREFGNFEMEGRIPSIGKYEDIPYPQWVYERHLDQMSGFGVTTVRIEVGTISGDPIIKSTERFLESTLVDQVDIGVHYSILSHLWKEEGNSTADDYRKDLIEPHMRYIRDNIFSRENVSTHDGRPVMDIWNPVRWVGNDYIRGRVMDEWGSYEALIDDIRSHLRVDGKDPFIVGGFGGWGENYHYSTFPRNTELAKQFDGISSWVGAAAWGEDNFATQDEALSFIEENWQGHRKFVDEHGMEFIPMVFPGFNEVKGDQRRTPRSPEFFADSMRLADKYRTTDMVWTPPYNNWEEATHFEPGVFEPGPFGKEDYGTAYLEKVKQFQQGGAR